MNDLVSVNLSDFLQSLLRCKLTSRRCFLESGDSMAAQWAYEGRAGLQQGGNGTQWGAEVTGAANPSTAFPSAQGWCWQPGICDMHLQMKFRI